MLTGVFVQISLHFSLFSVELNMQNEKLRGKHIQRLVIVFYRILQRNTRLTFLFSVPHIYKRESIFLLGHKNVKFIHFTYLLIRSIVKSADVTAKSVIFMLLFWMSSELSRMQDHVWLVTFSHAWQSTGIRLLLCLVKKILGNTFSEPGTTRKIQ